MIPTARVRRWARTCGILAASARMQVLVVRTNPMIPLTAVAQPAVFLTIVMARSGPMTPSDRTAQVAAVLLTSLWGATLWAAGGTLRLEMVEGTLARNLTAVSDARAVIIGKCIGSTCLVLGFLLGTAVVMVVATGTQVQLREAGWWLLGLVLVAVSATAMGYLLCPVFVLTRHATHVTAALTYPVFILSGLMIPSGLLPRPMAWLSRPISLFWANGFFTSLAHGSPDAASLAAVAVLTAGYFWIGGALLDRLIDRARRAGTIDVG